MPEMARAAPVQANRDKDTGSVIAAHEERARAEPMPDGSTGWRTRTLARKGGPFVAEGGREGTSPCAGPPRSVTVTEAEEGAAVIESAIEEARSQGEGVRA